MSMEFTLNDLQRQRVEDHLALVEQVLRRSIKTNETVDGMGHDDLYQEGCIALCRAAVSYREEMGAFPAYARTVIRNYLLDRCREIQSARKNLPLLSLDAFAEMGAPEPVSPFHTEDLISDVSSDALLSHFRNRYHGTARLGIEAMELRVRGYSCTDIAKLYQKKPNYIGACISRAAEKLRRERIVREFYTACTEQDTLIGYLPLYWHFLYISIALAAERSCMAEVHVFGRVTNDLQLKMSHRQVPYVSFGLVEWIGRRDTGHRQYFEVWAWGTAALSLADAEIHKDSRIWVQGFLELVDCTRNGGSEKDKRLKLSLTGWQTKPPRTERRPARKQSPGAAQPPLPPVEVVDGDRERLPE